MKKSVMGVLAALPMALGADVLPSINCKGGAMVLPEGKWKLGINHIQFERNDMFEGTNEVQNKENLNAKANVTIIGLNYGLSEKTSLGLIVPYKNMEASAMLGTNDVAIDNNGIGDVVIAARHVLLPMDQYGYQIALDGAIKLPTGSTDKGFKKAPPIAEGVNTPMPTQTGTGEFEYKLGLGASKMIDEGWRVDSNLMYTYRPKANNDYDFGNELNFVLGTTKALSDTFNAGIDYTFTYNSDTDMGTDTNEPLRAMLPFKAFSGTSGYVTPQIEFVPFGKPKMHIGAGVSFLVHYDVDEYQPMEKTRFLLNMGYLF